MRAPDPGSRSSATGSGSIPGVGELPARGFIDALEDAVHVIDPGTGRILYVNPAGRQATGYALETACELCLSDLSETLAETVFPDGVSDGVRKDLGARVRASLRCEDGSELPVEVRLSRVEAAKGPLVIAVSREVEPADATDRRLARYARALAASDQRLQDFAYILSHDLREPIRMIKSYLGLLERRYSEVLDDDAHEFIDYAVDGADRMDGMVQGLLDYSRVETRGGAFEPVDLGAALDQAVASLEDRVDEAGARIEHDPLPTISADHDQMAQLFEHLLSNAIKFRDEAPPRIEITAEDHPDGCLVHVSDNGIGLDPDESERIFKVYQRLNGPGEYEGTGMGLALSRRIVERHGGEISATSTPGEGSTFTVFLPSQPPAEDDGDHPT